LATVDHLVVKLTSDAPSIALPNISQQEVSSSLGLSLSYDIIAANGGSLQFSEQAQQIACQVELPLLPPDESLVQ
jgi:nitrogen-specific signal transduction histidine kinase